MSWSLFLDPITIRFAIARLAFLLLTVCLLACSGLPPVPPFVNAGQVAHAPGEDGAAPTSESGRPEPVTLWQDGSIFQLVARLIGSAHSRVMVEMYELGRRDITSALGAARARRGGARTHGSDRQGKPPISF